VLAQQALTAALAVGPGRLMLGIGLSHKIVIENMYGYSFDRPVRHMREYLSALLPLLDGTAGRVGTEDAEPGRGAGRRDGPVDDRACHRPRLRGPGHLCCGKCSWPSQPASRVHPAGLRD
jgi:alkanesulfonate monooxygenase SsuD/methylene tetrahydromethanopterin reductase-like flavin-dependent oxidoreductase (luciferase family)